MKSAWQQVLLFTHPLIAVTTLAADIDPAQVTLIPPAQSEAYLPRETLTIELGAFNPKSSATQLSLELDAIDVTAMASLTSHSITFTPVQPLSTGQHEMRLVAYQADGSISELGYWTLNVRAQHVFRDASLSGQATLTVSQNLQSSAPFDHTPKRQTQGNASYQTQATIASVKLSANFDLMYLNPSTYSPTGETLDLGSFVARAENDFSSATIGHQLLAEPGLIFDGYQKRGISISGNWSASQIHLFGMSSQDLVGRDDLLGINDEQNRYHGGMIKSQLWQSETFESHFVSTYLSGKRSQAGYGNWLEPADATKATTWGVTLDNYWLSRQFRLRLEGASSKNHGENLPSDTAYSALMMISPSLTSAQWQLGAEAKKVGANYISLANPYLPKDRSSERLFTSLNTGKWSLTASSGRETSNLDDLPDRATTVSKLHQLNLSYSNYEPPREGSLMAWLGSPSYTLTLQQSSLKDKYTPPETDRQDSISRALLLNTSFAATHWQWSFGYSLQSFEDDTDTQIDSRIHSLFANLNLRFGEAVNLQPGWQRQRTDNLDYGNASYSTLYSLTGQFTLIPRRLDATLSWNHNALESLNDPFYLQDNRSQFLSGSITWQLRQAKSNRSGIELSLSASSQSYHDYLFTQNNSDNYQVFLTIKTTLPSQISGGLQ